MDYFIGRKGRDFNRRKEMLQIWAQTCTVDELREHIFGKLKSVNGPQELYELEASIKPFWDNILYSYGHFDIEEEPTGIESDPFETPLIDQESEVNHPDSLKEAS
jgi:hypothetical protein